MDYNWDMVDLAFCLGFRAHPSNGVEKHAEYPGAMLLGALLGGALGRKVGGQYGFWFSSSPAYRDVNRSELGWKVIGGLGGAAAGAGLGAATLGILRALGKA